MREKAASVFLQAVPTVGVGLRMVFCQSNRVTYICPRGSCGPSFARRVGKGVSVHTDAVAFRRNRPKDSGLMETLLP